MVIYFGPRCLMRILIVDIKCDFFIIDKFMLPLNFNFNLALKILIVFSFNLIYNSTLIMIFIEKNVLFKY